MVKVKILQLKRLKMWVHWQPLYSDGQPLRTCFPKCSTLHLRDTWSINRPYTQNMGPHGLMFQVPTRKIQRFYTKNMSIYSCPLRTSGGYTLRTPPIDFGKSACLHPKSPKYLCEHHTQIPAAGQPKTLGFPHYGKPTIRFPLGCSKMF